jgi:DNA-binding SARP family transcriptional activator/diadenosine tetraphosphatase ApaH/serine/threonine PP2A family protein phosphatase
VRPLHTEPRGAKRRLWGAKEPLKEGATAIEFRILGPLEAVEGGRPVALGGSKQRALLALLLLDANRVVSRDRLIDELWDGSPPETASTALQVHVSQLRKALGRDTIVTRAPGYILTVEPGALDLQRFESLVEDARGRDAETAAAKLREALGLWRGPPLADLDDAVARAERAQLEERRAETVEQRIDADLERGLHSELVPELERLVREDPLRERRRAQLMLALYRGGRQADALETYRAGRKLLADELGLEPGPELRRLEQAILAHDQGLAAPAPPPHGPAATGRRRRHSRAAAAIGALLLAGAIAGLVVALTGGSGTVVIQPNSVAVVDPETGRFLADVPIGGRPRAIAIGAGAVWAINGDDQTIVRIDPTSRKVVKTIGGLGTDVSDLAVGFGSVWVAGGNDGTLTRIDAQTNAPEAPIDLGGGVGPVQQPVFLVAVGDGKVWVARGNMLLQIDPETNEARPWLRVRRPQGLTAGRESVWLTQESEHVLRVDATTPKVTADEDVLEQPFFPVLFGDSLWLILYAERARVARLDTSTLATSAQIAFAGANPYELDGGERAIWSVDPDSATLWRIDPATNRAAKVAGIPHHPVTVAAGEGAVWVGTQKDPLR